MSALAILHSSRRTPWQALRFARQESSAHSFGRRAAILARNTSLGAKLQTLQQVDEQTASHLCSGCPSQGPRLHLLVETFRISRCREAVREIRTDRSPR